MLIGTQFEKQIDEFMLYCETKGLAQKTRRDVEIEVVSFLCLKISKKYFTI